MLVEEEEDKDYEIEMDVELEQNEEFEDRHPLFYFELFLDEEFYYYLSKESKKYFDKNVK